MAERGGNGECMWRVKRGGRMMVSVTPSGFSVRDVSVYSLQGFLELNKDLHITGKPINLTKKEEKHDGKWYWAVQYYKPDDTKFIRTFGDPDAPEIPVFTTGTLTMSGLPTAIINIKLENGRVKGSDGNEHTLTLSYSGTMTNR
ncbi:hypothetical protein [Prevotella koreensis]|uniref:hypothetical protein n=1 Tax=Prevotella koreensis TaxID=2490854 RepID=UPI0028E512EC|nr:hypothetical protein [Prevotella koreensis]